jgi:hypothetical protein
MSFLTAYVILTVVGLTWFVTAALTSPEYDDNFNLVKP